MTNRIPHFLLTFSGSFFYNSIILKRQDILIYASAYSGDILWICTGYLYDCRNYNNSVTSTRYPGMFFGRFRDILRNFQVYIRIFCGYPRNIEISAIVKYSVNIHRVPCMVISEESNWLSGGSNIGQRPKIVNLNIWDSKADYPCVQIEYPGIQIDYLTIRRLSYSWSSRWSVCLSSFLCVETSYWYLRNILRWRKCVYRCDTHIISCDVPWAPLVQDPLSARLKLLLLLNTFRPPCTTNDMSERRVNSECH